MSLWRIDPAAAPTAAMRQVLDRLAHEDAGLPEPTTLPAAEGRALVERTNHRWNGSLPSGVSRDVLAPLSGCRFECFRPVEAQPGAILYVHGGGWAFCSLDTHAAAMARLALASGREVYAIDYRLAPEAPYPAGLDDVDAAWCALRARLDSPVGVAGDSAGANLALALMLRLVARGDVLPAVGLLFYGVFDAADDTPAHRAFGDGRFVLSTEKMNRYWDWYVPDTGLRHTPLCAPLRAEDTALRALPPLFLNAAGLDPLLSDTLSLAGRLQGLGRTDDELVVHPGVVHGFMQMASVLEEARMAFAVAGRFAAAKLAGQTR